MATLFIICLAVIMYVYFGYPLLLMTGILGVRKPRQKSPTLVDISIIVPAHNEELTIERKLQNLLAIDYPPDRLTILIGSDGSTDCTDEIVREYAEKGVELIATATQRGKSCIQNDLVGRSSGSILFFTDADCLIAPDAIRCMLENFADSQVGLVTAAPSYQNAEETYVTQNESLYLRYEKWLRLQESERGLLVAASGSLFALRRSQWRPLNPSLGDDFVLPLQVTLRGLQNVFEPRAGVTTRLTQDRANTMVGLKTRIISKDLRALLLHSRALNPWFAGFVAVGLWSHKILRWLVPYFLVGMLLSSLLLMRSEPFRVFFALQAVFYGLALAAALFGRQSIPFPWSVPLSFCLVNFAALIGTLHCATGHTIGQWKPVR